MKYVLDLIYLLIAILISPFVIYRMVRYNRYKQGWANRLGIIKRKNLQKKCIWIHAVSVGEVNATKTVIEELKNKFKDIEILISTTTDTGFARANSLYGNDLNVSYFPFDLSWSMYRAFREIRPCLCLLMELEVWPNFVDIANKLNVPVIVVNGRISENSFSKYKKIKPIAKRIFQKIDLILSQTEEYAQRFKDIGCPPEKVVVTGSLKYDTAQITDKVDGADELASQLKLSCHCEPEQSEGAAISNLTNKIASVASLPRNDGTGNEKLLVAGATGNDEEKIILEVYKKLKAQNETNYLRLVIVPRKPERFDEVAELIKQNGYDLIRYSQVKNSSHEPQMASIEHRASSIESIILGDTMGDLRKFYSLATIIFVGRSLVPMGGWDMAEAAALGKCTIFGPYAFNFKQTVGTLIENDGAILVNDADELFETIKKCLSKPDFAKRIAHNGQETIRKNQGATTRSIDEISKFLK